MAVVTLVRWKLISEGLDEVHVWKRGEFDRI